MGLQNQISDVASESILVTVLVLIARCACYLRTLVQATLRSLSDRETSLHDAAGSALAELVVFCERFAMNRSGSRPYRPDPGEDRVCVVCLDRLREAEEVRALACGHVFHGDCLDGWLRQLNLSCPLCRAPLDPERPVGGEFHNWFQASADGF